MANDSSTGGYLTPVGLRPAYDQALVAQLQGVVVGISGIPGNMVRPRWQPEPPNLPPFGADWVALGVTTTRADTFPYIHHISDGEGSDEVIRGEDLELFCSFYGPNSAGYASTLRDGLFIDQNRDTLKRNSIVLGEVGPMTAVPELVNERWRGRTDITVSLRRQVRVTYAILNLLAAQADIITDVDLQLRIDTP